MASIFKVLQPYEYFKAFRELGKRHDGRKPNEFRFTTLHAGSLTKCNGSSVIRCGETAVTCGITAELAAPKDESPHHGYLVPNVSIPESCSYQFSAGSGLTQANELSQIVTEQLITIINSSKCIKTEDLCIEKGKLCWCLYCDIVCLSYDGSLLDAALLALVAALRNTKLCGVTVDSESGESKVELNVTVPLTVYNTPVATTWLLYNDGPLYVDGDSEEESLSDGVMTVAFANPDTLCLLHKPGGAQVDGSIMQKCFATGRKRYDEVVKLIRTS